MGDKTNAARILDQHKIQYKHYTYSSEGAISGVEVATLLGQDVKKVFKTLVTVGKSNKNYVFMVPVAEELDLKKAAACVCEKSIDMIKSALLLPTTGYIHGGCSPVGMKKVFPTVIDASALNCESIIFSGGRIGQQFETTLSELAKVVRFKTAEIVGGECGEKTY